MTKEWSKSKERDDYDIPRHVLGIPKLTNQELYGARRNIQLIAQAICEYVWAKKFC